MILSEIQKLPIDAKRDWVQSKEGLAQLQEWLSARLPLGSVAQMLQISNNTIYRWRYHYKTVAVEWRCQSTMGEQIYSPLF